MHKFLALLILSLVVGCSSPNLDNTNYNDPTLPESGGSLTNAMIGEPNNLIAMIAGDSASSAIAGQIFNSLLKYDENLDFEGDLADNWTISDDYKKITFNLKQDIKWADDKPITCEDVLFTWKKVTDPDTRTTYGSDYQLVSSALCADNHTFFAEYDEPYAPALKHGRPCTYSQNIY